MLKVIPDLERAAENRRLAELKSQENPTVAQANAMAEIDQRPQAPGAHSDLAEPAPGEVAVCIPHSWEFTPRLMNASLQILQTFGGKTYYIDGASIANMRNRAVAQIRRERPQPKKMLFVDADMVFRSDSLLRLWRHNVPIAGGLCRQRKHPFGACLWDRIADGWIQLEPEGSGLKGVAATGAAFLLIDLKVFDEIDKTLGPQRYFVDNIENTDLPVGQRVSEDVFFCALARKVGYETAVDMDLKIGHLTMAQIIDDDDHHPTCIFEKGGES